MQFSPVSCYFLLRMPKSLPQHPILEYPKPFFLPGCERSSLVRSICQKVFRQSGMTPFPYLPGNLQYWMWRSSAFQWLQREDSFKQSAWPGASQKTVGFECEVGRTGGLEPLHSGWQYTAQLDCTLWDLSVKLVGLGDWNPFTADDCTPHS